MMSPIRKAPKIAWTPRISVTHAEKNTNRKVKASKVALNP